VSSEAWRASGQPPMYIARCWSVTGSASFFALTEAPRRRVRERKLEIIRDFMING
jgi:hypothetical protein